jgi:hypothetical protein
LPGKDRDKTRARFDLREGRFLVCLPLCHDA